MAKISTYSVVPTSGYSAVNAIVDGNDGTRRVPLSLYNDYADTPTVDIDTDSDSKWLANAIAHRKYRGKNLGTTITPAQLEAIISGTFEDLYVGDYWLLDMSGTGNSSQQVVKIADVDYFYKRDISAGVSGHHIVALLGSIVDAPYQRNDIYVTLGHRAVTYNYVRGGGAGVTLSTDNRGRLWANRSVCSNFKHIYGMTKYYTNQTHTDVWDKNSTDNAMKQEAFYSVDYGNPNTGAEDGIAYELLGEEDIFGSMRGGGSCGTNYGGTPNYPDDYRMFAIFEYAPWTVYRNDDSTMYLATFSTPSTGGASAGSQVPHICVLTPQGGVYVHGANESHAWLAYTVIG